MRRRRAQAALPRRGRSWRALWLLPLLACAPRQESPATAYRAFAKAVESRDATAVWELLSSDTRAWLEERARSAAKAAPGVVSPEAEELVLGAASRASAPLDSVVVLRESRDLAVVEVVDVTGARREVELVAERGWRVRIPPPGGPGH